MPGGVTFLESADADIPTPAAGKVTVYFSTDLPGPAYKDEFGVVFPLGTTGATGATGIMGPPGIDGEDANDHPIGVSTSLLPTSAGITQLTSDVTAGPGVGSQVATIPNNTVTYAKMQDVSAASRLLGRGSAAGSGDPQEITLGAGLALTGTSLDVTSSGGITELTGDVTAGPGSGSQAATIGAKKVTYAKIQDVTFRTILARQTAGNGVVEECTLSQVLDMISPAQGDILYRDAAAWARLPAGTVGQVLTTGGSGANPSWSASVIGIQKATKILTDAQIKALNTTPIEIVAAPGSGKIVIPILMSFHADWSAGAYNTSQNINLVYAGNTTAVTTALAHVSNVTGIRNAFSGPVAQGFLVATFDISNKALNIRGGNDLTGGNAANSSTVDCYYITMSY